MLLLRLPLLVVVFVEVVVVVVLYYNSISSRIRNDYFFSLLSSCTGISSIICYSMGAIRHTQLRTLTTCFGYPTLLIDGMDAVKSPNHNGC